MSEADTSARLARIADELVASYRVGDTTWSFESGHELPSPSELAVVLDEIRELIFPGFGPGFSSGPLRSRRGGAAEVEVAARLGQVRLKLGEQLFAGVHHRCRVRGGDCGACAQAADGMATALCGSLPTLRQKLLLDVRAAYEGDPAATGTDEVVFSYPGVTAVFVYRVAHRLRELGAPIVPRMMAELAHAATGIDIHPGAEIGESFFIDHGTGVVIGETTIIGARVRLYQGVTLGALSLSADEVAKLRHQKRHPTIEDDVVIYANATILGGDTVIGRGTVVGGNSWITRSLPATPVAVRNSGTP